MSTDLRAGATRTLHHPEGVIRVMELEGQRRRVEVQPVDPALFVAFRSCETSYSLALIERLLAAKGPGWLCDEIRRDEDPGYVQRSLAPLLGAYARKEELTGARLLDFGCGSGASMCILKRLLPSTEVVGVELEPALAAIARMRLAHHGFGGVRVEGSPSPVDLPAGLGEFDFVLLTAVFEHLLPHERRVILPKLWSILRPGGVLLLTETPHRWSPVESHSTKLPLLNYLPRSPALAVARRLSSRIDRDASDEELLRGGIRGATTGEILKLARGTHSGHPRLMAPYGASMRDALDVWYDIGTPTTGRRTARIALRAVNRILRRNFAPWLHIGIRKEGR